MKEGKNNMDRSELRAAYDAALYKIKFTMPLINESPQDHVARCWYEAIQEVLRRRK